MLWIIFAIVFLLLFFILVSVVNNIKDRNKLKKAEKQIASLKAESSKFAQELLKQKKEFDSIVVPIEGPTEIEWRKEDVQVISRNAFVDDNIIYPNRAITKNQLIVVYKPPVSGDAGGIKIFAYIGKINVKNQAVPLADDDDDDSSDVRVFEDIDEK